MASRARKGPACTVPPATITRTAPAGPTPRAAGRRLSAMSTTAPESNSPSATPLDVQIERTEKSLERLLEWIRAVDAKTPVVMAIDTAMLGVLAALAPAPRDLSPYHWLSIALGTLALIASLGLCAAATFPQTEGPKGSVIYFGGIAARSAFAFADTMRTLSSAEYLEDLLHQCHRNAEIARHKFASLRRALYWLFGGILPWLAALYLLSRA